ncbi:unnamed protein product [Triticum turgidum subsp. durum]|uniref:Flowering-promoting factor 1-like protein 3 n=1 Tax=Triticum turgidum subsp. durum TaxID=4567 RepID=A0A9R0YDN7_TRITD|nr:unnamed protein product [Triticum turgidum subsp. durum]
MSGVWVFEGGMVRRADSEAPGAGGAARPGKVLLGWERYLNDPCLLQFHQRSTVHLISVPRDFTRLKLVHMHDVVVKTRNVFQVRDA